MVGYIAILVAAVASMVIGYIWYGPLFGKKWMGLMGMKSMAPKGNMAMSYVISYIGAVIMAYVLSVFIGYAGAATYTDGAMIGFWAWLGFVATTQLGKRLWEGKPWELYILDTVHYLVSFAAMGAILVMMA